jgi:hypothetical protein
MSLKTLIVFGGFMRKLCTLIALNIITGSSVIAQVDTAWVRSYDCGGNENEAPVAIGYDAAGNIFMTGYSYGTGVSSDIITIKYYSNGDTAWVRRYSSIGHIGGFPSSLVVDDQGNIYVAGNVPEPTEYCFYSVLIKYLSNGDLAWYRLFGGQHGEPIGPIPYPVLAIGNSGYVYVAGDYGYREAPNDALISKYGPNGNQIWARLYSNQANSYDYFYAIALDSVENILVTGYTSQTSANILTAKYKSSGQRLWVSLYNDSLNFDDYGYFIASGEAGNIYVAGTSGQINACADLTLIKYNPNGDTVWTRYYNGPADRDETAGGLAVDNSGDIVVCGASVRWVGNSLVKSFITIKYSDTGTELWRSLTNDLNAPSEIPYGMCTDAYNNIYVTGYRGNHLLMVKYCPNGDTAWSWYYEGAFSGKEIGVNSSSNIYIAGESDYYNSDFTMIKLTQAQTKIEELNKPLPSSFSLHSNYPNPFNANTIISYDLPKEADVKLEIFDLLGRKVATLTEGMQQAGTHKAIWDGSGHSSGIYFYRLKAGDFTDIKKMTLLK